MSSTSSTLVPGADAPSSRALLALRAMHRCAAHPDLGASEDDIKGVLHDASDEPIQHNPKNLVALLIKDNAGVYNKLLHNRFCHAMSQAPATDTAVADGFKWYMIQDFLYCANLMLYDTARASKAPDVATYETLVQKLKDDADYAVQLLKTCADPQNLGIPANIVIGAVREDATKQYTEFSVETAEHTDWIISLVAMIPCIQSYYQIARMLEKDSLHKDTPWYKLWVAENLKYGSATQHQAAFFVANFDTWRAVPYATLCDIFTRACNHEIALWTVGERPGRVR